MSDNEYFKKTEEWPITLHLYYERMLHYDPNMKECIMLLAMLLALFGKLAVLCGMIFAHDGRRRA